MGNYPFTLNDNDNECISVKPFQNAVPLSVMNDQQQLFLELIQRGPVALIADEKVAGVLLSPAQWAAITKTLEAAQECLTALDASVGRKE